MRKKFSPQELELHIQSGRLSWKEDPVTWAPSTIKTTRTGPLNLLGKGVRSGSFAKNMMPAMRICKSSQSSMTKILSVLEAMLW